MTLPAAPSRAPSKNSEEESAGPAMRRPLDRHHVFSIGTTGERMSVPASASSSRTRSSNSVI